jgi:6-phosphogluconolactonase
VRLDVRPDPHALALRAVELVEEIRPHVVGLSGGSTPRETYSILGERGTLREAAVLLVDERCVPPDHEASNYRLIRETLGDLPNIVRVLGEEEDPDRAADAYELAIRDILGEQPVIDLVLLGIGDDGHTASLFPGAPELEESGRVAVATGEPHNGYRRVTLTFPVLNRARERVFLVEGDEKRGPVARVAAGEDLPAGRIVDPLWLLDTAAAAGIQTR